MKRFSKLIRRIQSALTPDLLRGQWVSGKGDHPLTGHCYIGAEALFHSLPKGHSFKPFMLNHALWPKGLDPTETHWFLKNANGTILDPTAGQFGSDPIAYEAARACGFLTKLPSKRAQIVLSRIAI